MKELPILFSGPMVQAILDGRKTMTRRVVKPQPAGDEFNGFNAFGEAIFYPRSDDSDDAGLRRCPHGQPGDRLWVRETWQHNPYGGIVYRAGSGILNCDGRGWRSPICMPRWASRITLEITAVRVERVQDISEEDAMSEGAMFCNHGVEHDGMHYRCGFCALWNSLNAKRGYGWDTNPWVWVLAFKRLP